MNTLTSLEREVLSTILYLLVKDKASVAHIIRSLVISERSFSPDVANPAKCSGFYLNFAQNDLLAGINGVPHHLSVQAGHEATPAGGDFILYFRKDKAGLDFLEGTFFDYTLPKDDLLSENHGFTIHREE